MKTKLFGILAMFMLLSVTGVMAASSSAYSLSGWGGNVANIKTYSTFSSTSANAYIGMYSNLAISSGQVLVVGKLANGKSVIAEVYFNVNTAKTVGKVTTITGKGYGSIQENNNLKQINNENIVVSYSSQTKKMDITGTGDVKFKVTGMPTTKN